MTKAPVELKYNKTTRFILPALKLDETQLLMNGFINAYLQDHEYDVRWDFEKCIFLLFKPINFNTFESYSERLRLLSCYKDEYDINEGRVVFVMEIPLKYQSILNSFISGKYSEFDKKYIKECIPEFVNDKLSKRWKIFYKDQELLAELAKELGYKSLDTAKKYINELEDLPRAEDEILRYNPEINTNLTRRNND